MINQKQIAIIGAGLAGMTAAYDLAEQGASVTIFEASDKLGGLAAGFRGRAEWAWPLEHFYHHLFTNDDAIIDLTLELGLSDALEFHDPTTVMYLRGQNYPFDSPLRLLQFPHLSLPDKLRMGAVIAYLRYHPRPPWKAFDQKLADRWLARWMGQSSHEMLWRPMLEGKFGARYGEINLAWFWARIYKRTKQLGYYRGGFQALVEALASGVLRRGVRIHTAAPVQQVTQATEGGFRVESNGTSQNFDVVISTTSPSRMVQIAPGLPRDYAAQLASLQSMGAVVLTVALDRQLLTDGTYWVNVPTSEGLPFVALVEHTNMIEPAHYDGDHLLYIGNYLETDHPHFGMSADEILADFAPYLSRFNADFDPSWVRGAWVHKAKYAQPVPTVGYNERIPDLRTGVPGLYLASMSQVYPWDRGTNYAVEMGRRVAALVVEDVGKLSDKRAKAQAAVG